MKGEAAAATVRIISLVTQENVRRNAVGIRVTSIPIESIAQGLHVAEFGRAGSLCPRVSDCTVLLESVITVVRYHRYLGTASADVIDALSHRVEVVIRPRNGHMVP